MSGNDAPELAVSMLLDLHLHQAAMKSNPLLWFSFCSQVSTTLLHSLTPPVSASMSTLNNLHVNHLTLFQTTFQPTPLQAELLKGIHH